MPLSGPHPPARARPAAGVIFLCPRRFRALGEKFELLLESDVAAAVTVTARSESGPPKHAILKPVSDSLAGAESASRYSSSTQARNIGNCHSAARVRARAAAAECPACTLTVPVSAGPGTVTVRLRHSGFRRFDTV